MAWLGVVTENCTVL